MMDPTTNRDAIGYLGEQARLDGPPNDRELALIEKCEEYLRWVVAENERLRVVADAARNVVAQWRGDISRKPHIGRLRDALAKLDAAGQSGKGGAMSDAPKPWEETWTWIDGEEAEDEFPEQGGTLYALRPDGRPDCDRRIIETDSGVYPPKGAERALIAAAPEMARLLLDLEWAGWNQEGYDPSDACPSCGQHPPSKFIVPARRIDAYTRVEAHEEIRGGHAPDCRWVAVLRKAGVLPTP